MRKVGEWTATAVISLVTGTLIVGTIYTLDMQATKVYHKYKMKRKYASR